MNKDIKNFLETIDSLSIKKNEIFWKLTAGDDKFFNECVEKLKEFDLKSVLDIACGAGEFVKQCLKNHIEAYGIDPHENKGNPDNIYNGTFKTILLNQKILKNSKFDCISILNVLHGKKHKNDEILKLLKFLKNYSKYIIISDPINNPSIKLKGFELIHTFDGSHGGKSTIHKLYKIAK